MTTEEIIQNLNFLAYDDSIDAFTDYREELKTAINVLEKQIPEKPIEKFSTESIFDGDGNYVEQCDTMTFRCPTCENVLMCGDIEKSDCANIHFCENCGQAIDWSETE